MEEDIVFEKRGYKKYPREPHDYPEIVHMYYKRFKGDHCIKYFIAAHLWELSTDKNGNPVRMYEYTVYFNQKGKHCSLRLFFYAGWTLDDVEEYCDKMYNSGLFEPYEEC